jgi:hypothetical protein
VGDEGWFALKTIPPTCDAAGPTATGVCNFLGNPDQPYPHNVGAGLGGPDAKGACDGLLDKVSDVTPLRATALGLLAKRKARVCAVVPDGDIGMNYGPLNGSLERADLGTVALKVTSARPLASASSGTLPPVEVEVLDAGKLCEEDLQLFADAPEPTSSSQPADTGS